LVVGLAAADVILSSAVFLSAERDVVAGFTVILTVFAAVLIPSAVFTVSVTGPPTFLPVTFPAGVTVAMDSSLDVQTTFLFVAVLSAKTVVRFIDLPTPTVHPAVVVASALLNSFHVTEDMVAGFTTVTVHVAVLPLPSRAVTVIVEVPEDRALTTPVLLTSATLGLLDLYVKFAWPVRASTGVGVTVNVKLVGTVTPLTVYCVVARVCFVAERVSFVVSGNTLTLIVFVTALFPTRFEHEMMVSPIALAVTTPFGLTVATAGLLDCHVNVLFVGFEGVKVGTMVNVFFRPTAAVVVPAPIT
jgi:hypothetical protein